MRSAIEWKVDFKKSDGKVRKQFKQWSIPNGIKRQYKIEDGDRFLLTVTYSGRELFSDDVSVTSGGEIGFKNEFSKKVKTLAEKGASGSITLSLGGLDIASEIESTFEDDVREAMDLDPNERQKRLKVADKKPKRILVLDWAFKRNHDVVAEVLLRAGDACERCGKSAPFKRRTDNSPYLEVHHKKQLSMGGDDTVENAIALCPNCHREAHFG